MVNSILLWFIQADFRATGQTGIMISGGGIPMDAVVSDFAAGAAEMLSPAAAPDSPGTARTSSKRRRNGAIASGPAPRADAHRYLCPIT